MGSGASVRRRLSTTSSGSLVALLEENDSVHLLQQARKEEEVELPALSVFSVRHKQRNPSQSVYDWAIKKVRKYNLLIYFFLTVSTPQQITL